MTDSPGEFLREVVHGATRADMAERDLKRLQSRLRTFTVEQDIDPELRRSPNYLAALNCAAGDVIGNMIVKWSRGNPEKGLDEGDGAEVVRVGEFRRRIVVTVLLTESS